MSILHLQRAMLFQGLLAKLGSLAHFNAICFSFSMKLSATKGIEDSKWKMAFQAVAKGKYERICVCLTMKT